MKLTQKQFSAQVTSVKEHLQDQGEISTDYAFAAYGVTQLSVIMDEIASTGIVYKKRNGDQGTNYITG